MTKHRYLHTFYRSNNLCPIFQLPNKLNENIIKIIYLIKKRNFLKNKLDAWPSSRTVWILLLKSDTLTRISL